MRRERIIHILKDLANKEGYELPYLDTLEIKKTNFDGDAPRINCTVNRGNPGYDKQLDNIYKEAIIEIEFETFLGIRLFISEE
jgi:hypothetical protein